MIMGDHLQESYDRQLSEAELSEPIQREREEVLEDRDEELNMRSMVSYLIEICRRMRAGRAVNNYLPEVVEGVVVAVADASALLDILNPWENGSPVKLVALRRAATGQWLRQDEDEEEDEMIARELSALLLKEEVKRGLVLAVAAAAETVVEELWGTPEEDDQRSMAVVRKAARLEEESARAVERLAQRAFHLYR